MADWQGLDPEAAREAQKYEHPIPSRELILAHLSGRGAPATREQLLDEFNLTDEAEVEALRRRLRAMERDGQLLFTRRGAYAPVDKLDLVCGRISGHRDGFGFLIPDEGGDDLFLSPAQMRLVFDGDKALAQVSGVDRRGRPEGVLVEVVARAHETLVGRFFDESGIARVVSDNPKIQQEVLIHADKKGAAKHGQFVSVRILQWPSAWRQAEGEVIEVLGDYMAPGMEIEVALRTYDIPHIWPAEVEAEAAKLKPEVAEKDKAKRIDLRHLPFVTIDGEDARDFDDAVYVEARKGGGWRLYVGIADVSHYVKVGSPLDAEAANRGNSVYFPERVIPMLPEVLSNGLCSLNPQVDRLVMVCEVEFSRSGKMGDFRFCEAVIHSHARLTYTKVSQFLETPDSPEAHAFAEQNTPLVGPLTQLYKLYKVLLAARHKRGAIDFETQETRIVFNAERKIAEIRPTQRNEAHRLIEECMLAANVATAQLLQTHALPALYRVHAVPPEDRQEKLRLFLTELGLTLGRGKGAPTPTDYQVLLEAVHDRPDFHLIQTVLLRSLSQAVYSPENEGHFGLNYEAYTHFTSPIRRYPDLLVHRAIRSLIRSKIESPHLLRAGAASMAKARIYPYDESQLAELGEHCSQTERRADEATRDVVSWLKCEYMQERVGEVFAGVITAVTGFGLFIELSEIYVEGLLHITALPGDYYQFDAVHHRLVGEHSRKVFRLGDSLEVRVVRVDLDDRKIDFELAQTPPSERKPLPSKKPSRQTKTSSAKLSRAAEPAPLGRKRKAGKVQALSPELLLEADAQLAKAEVRKSRAVKKALLDGAKGSGRDAGVSAQGDKSRGAKPAKSSHSAKPGKPAKLAKPAKAAKPSKKPAKPGKSKSAAGGAKRNKGKA